MKPEKTVDNNDALKAALIEGARLIDVRAPVEFTSTQIPGSLNHPILSTEERSEVGTCYKQQGAAAATQLGHRLVSGAIKSERVLAWINAIEQQGASMLFCARGGQRSRIACEWLAEQGYQLPRVEGGYKRIRQLLMAETTLLQPDQLLVLGGSTGVGKTVFLLEDSAFIDLEGLANHRGSAFGASVSPQPAQSSFENSLAIALMQWRDAGPETLLLEDEGRLIGRLQVPPTLQGAMKQAPLVVLEANLETRIEHIYQEYIVHQLQAFNKAAGSEGFHRFSEYLVGALSKIHKRLGGDRYRMCEQQMRSALIAHSAGDPEQHKEWISLLLTDYYDPMYTYQLSKKEDRMIFKGDTKAVREFLAAYRRNQRDQ
jgi:tRNA 2-selenouridine synthase